MMDSYERWPGFLRLKQRIEFVSSALGMLDVTGSAFLALDLMFEADGPIHRIFIEHFDVFFPSNKGDFERIDFRIPISFAPAREDSRSKLETLVGGRREKLPLHSIALWVHGGPSNNVICVYNARILNEGTTEIYIESKGGGGYALGLEANGNLFDSLLVSDELDPDDYKTILMVNKTAGGF